MASDLPNNMNFAKVEWGSEILGVAFLPSTKEKIKRFHLEKLASKPLCGRCSVQDITRETGWQLTCKTCNEWVLTIKAQISKGEHCQWKWSDMGKWKDDSWQIAKIFMKDDSFEWYRVLQLHQRCKLFDHSDEYQQQLKKVIGIRHKTAHLPTKKLTDREREVYFRDMEKLIKFLPEDHSKPALADLEKCRLDGPFPGNPDVDSVIQKLSHIENDMDDLKHRWQEIRDLVKIEGAKWHLDRYPAAHLVKSPQDGYIINRVLFLVRVLLITFFLASFVNIFLFY